MKRHPLVIALPISACLLLIACQTPPPSPANCPTVGAQAAEARPLVIDTDMGADDQMAILFLLQRPDVSLQAITVSGTGLAHCRPGMDNAAGLVALAGVSNIPVACGRETPLAGTHAFPDEWRTRSDNASGLTLPDGEPPLDVSAPDLLAQSIGGLPGQIKTTLLALGPLTNLAELLQQHPDIADKIERIVIMGGALDSSGNVAGSGPGLEQYTAAEWNVFVDPLAAQIVFESGIPITLVPLDATNHVPLDRAFFRHLRRDHHTPEADALYDWLAANPGMMNSGLYLWDQLAAALVVNPELATFRDVTLSVVTDEGPDSGRVIAAAGGTARAAVMADRACFEQVYLQTVNLDR
jgi:pyrimidine-specific ribonucleoside hydrolase